MDNKNVSSQPQLIDWRTVLQEFLQEEINNNDPNVTPPWGKVARITVAG